VLGVLRVASQRGLDFTIDIDVDLDACLGAALQDLVEAPFLVEVGRSPQKELGRKPPVGNVDGLGGPLNGNK